METENTFPLPEKVKTDPLALLAAVQVAATTAVPTALASAGEMEAKDELEGSDEAVGFGL